MEDQVLDNNLIAEEIEKDEQQWAGFWIRVGATLIDFFVYAPFIAFNIYNLIALKSLPLQLLLAVVMWAYKPYMEYRYGATFGKMAVKIKVVNYQFERISLTKSVVRDLPYLLGQFISAYGAVVLFQHPEFNSCTTYTDVTTLQGTDVVSSMLSTISSFVTILVVIFVAFSKRKQGLHDMLAKTYCIYNNNKK